MQISPPTQPAGFPCGRAYGLDFRHAALVGGIPRFSAVSTGAGVGMISLFPKPGQQGANSGFTHVMDPIMGHCIKSSSVTTNQMTFTGQTTVNDATITIACIFSTAVHTGTQCIFCMGDNGSSGWVMELTSAGILEIAGSPFTTASSSGITLAAGVPYFCAVSAKTGNQQYAVRNLITGQIQTATAATTMTLAAPNGTICVGNIGNDANSIEGNIAAVMASTAFMTVEELAEWAGDPWSFWYPPSDEEVFSLNVGISGAAVMGWMGEFFPPTPRLKRTDFVNNAFVGTSPALVSPYVQAPLFEPIKLKLRTPFEWQPFGTDPPLSTTFATSEFFPPTKLGRTTPFDWQPPGTSPALTVPYRTSNFFDPVKVKPPIPGLDFQPPGTSPAINSPYWTQAFFDVVVLKRGQQFDPAVPFSPPVAVSGLSLTNFFDLTKLKPTTQFDWNPPGTSPALSSPRSFDLWFDVVRLKLPIIHVPDIVPPMPAVAFNLDAWFDALRLLKVRLWDMDLPPAFTLEAPPPTAPFFDALRKVRLPDDFPFTKATVQLDTRLYALTDWFTAVRLKQPLVETPLVVYFPAQFVAPASAFTFPFIANMGSLTNR